MNSAGQNKQDSMAQSNLRLSAFNFARNLRTDEQISFAMDTESKLQTSQNQTFEDDNLQARKDSGQAPKRLSDRFMNIFAKKQAIDSVKQRDIKINAKRVLTFGLLFLMIEYMIYFVFTMISYYVINEFWNSTTYVLGTVVGILYLPVAIFLVTNVNRQEAGFLLLLKSIEFIMYLVLLGWGVAYLEFSILSLTYMTILNIMLLILIVM